MEEFWIPITRERADVVRIDGSLCCYEIKSSSDDLRRLSRQAEAFGRLFDFATIVVATRHLASANGLIPAWWGIIEAAPRAGRMALRQRRLARANPGAELELQIRLLWRTELVWAVSELGVNEHAGLTRDELRSLVVSAGAPSIVGQIVRQALLRRDPSDRRW